MRTVGPARPIVVTIPSGQCEVVALTEMRIGVMIPPAHDLILVPEFARLAEDAGFDFCSISDHFHPWVQAQGHSPFVWSVLGAIAATTDRLEILTGVTCPIMRIHPAVVAI